ncbi:hypothetical protein BELL_0164g00020 [Botrytis elliptica]|uniref:Uncharacterized protein n=1 Tax=Botrytis elliptica TaxID=278938 RepID=A0A4Z1K4H8_9HELO|nr:hypothetical protein EAE99_009466 [Botrytis elliptica]TGO76273.1 hypothetical protein BELL_0164g00020 [Botrytis elliptica]
MSTIDEDINRIHDFARELVDIFRDAETTFRGLMDGPSTSQHTFLNATALAFPRLAKALGEVNSLAGKVHSKNTDATTKLAEANALMADAQDKINDTIKRSEELDKREKEISLQQNAINVLCQAQETPLTALDTKLKTITDILSNQHAENAKACNLLETQIDEARKRNSELKSKTEGLEKELTETHLLVKQGETAKAQSDALSHQAEAAKNSALREAENLREELRTLKEQVEATKASATQETENLREESRTLKEQVEATKASAAQEIETSKEQLRALREEMETTKSSAAQEIEAKNRLLEQLKETKDALELTRVNENSNAQQIGAFKAELTTVKKQSEAAKKEEGVASEAAKDAYGKMENIKGQYTEQSKCLNQAQDDLRKTREENITLAERVKSLMTKPKTVDVMVQTEASDLHDICTVVSLKTQDLETKLKESENKTFAATRDLEQAKAEFPTLNSIHELVKSFEMRERSIESSEIPSISRRNRERSLTTQTSFSVPIRAQETHMQPSTPISQPSITEQSMTLRRSESISSIGTAISESISSHHRSVGSSSVKHGSNKRRRTSVGAIPPLIIESSEWNKLLALEHGFFSRFIPHGGTNVHQLRTRISRCFEERPGCFNKFVEYLALSDEKRKFWQCLSSIASDGFKNTKPITKDKPCPECGSDCIQIRAPATKLPDESQSEILEALLVQSEIRLMQSPPSFPPNRPR